MRSPVGKVGPEAVAADVFHFMLVWEGWDCALGVFSAKRLVEENEIGETATNFDGGLLEGGEIGLQWVSLLADT